MIMRHHPGGTVAVFTPIGVIQCDAPTQAGAPDGAGAEERRAGRVIVYPEYAKELKRIGSYAYLYLLYQMKGSGSPEAAPARDACGAFATRHRRRPNGIGLGIVRLVAREGDVLAVDDMDIPDGAPLLDIKPYLTCDSRQGAAWQRDPEARREALCH
jgi:tRNA (Thr-GGU) A37 N-methylase